MGEVWGPLIGLVGTLIVALLSLRKIGGRLERLMLLAEKHRGVLSPSDLFAVFAVLAAKRALHWLRR